MSDSNRDGRTPLIGRRAEFHKTLCLVGCIAAAVLPLMGCGAATPQDPSARTTAADVDSFETKASHKPAKNRETNPSKKKKDDPPVISAKYGDQSQPPADDVWFDDPLAELARGKAETRPIIVNVPRTEEPAEIASATPAKEPAETARAPARVTSTPNAENAPEGKTDWKSLVSVETIRSEINRIRANAKTNLRSVSVFDSHLKDIQVDATVLAALAGIVVSHPDSVTWKPRAKYVRDLAAKMCDQAKVTGQKALTDTRQTFEQITQLIDGNIPGDLPEAAEEIPFSQIVSRAKLMARIQSTSDWMKVTVANQASLKKEADRALQEAELAAAFGKVVSGAGYDSTDEPDYQRFAKELIYGALDAGDADRAQNFDAFSKARDRMEKSCTSCHRNFRFESGN